MNDLTYAFRGLRHSPGFACAAIVTLALGIAANGTVVARLSGVGANVRRHRWIRRATDERVG